MPEDKIMSEPMGRYEIVQEIGRGGFATVYRARDTSLARMVALKELRATLLQDEEWVRRFRREGQTIARLDHPHIVPIYDVYESDARLLIVMRLVDGPNLEQRLNRAGRLSWPEILEIIRAVASGLDYAYEQGILHRDLKPGNILLDPERGAMLTDFGMAKLLGEETSSITSAGGVVGTPHYIAPEIWESKGATRQSDIYALGCILYEMVTGEKIFRGETPPAVMLAHFRPLDLPRQWPEGTPPGLVEVLEKALARQPAERYSTAGELARDLAGLSLAKAGPEKAHAALPFAPGAGGDPADRVRARLSTPEPAEGEGQVEIEEQMEESRSGKWRGFLAHLGPYVSVIGMLFGIYLLTDPGGYPWPVWPALGWGVGIAFHLMALLVSEMKNLSGKWRGFVNHFGSYAIVITTLIMIYLLTDPGGYPWFIWPALGWGSAIAIHLWSVLLSGGDYREVLDEAREAGQAGWQELRNNRRKEREEGRKARRAEKERKRSSEASPAQPTTAKTPASSLSERAGALNPALRAHLEKAHTYQAQINALLKATPDRNVHLRLQELSSQVQEWMEAVEALARRVDHFQRNNIIQQDLESVPQAIASLERRLAAESDPATQAELERTLNNRRNQLAALEHLQRIIKRAEIKIESTLSSLGTIYSQMLISQSTDHVADYSRLAADVDEEVRTLQDHLEALEEVRLSDL
jgi:tRNA A-37 threonylcarbamoyl transferase component Bud32